MRPSRQWLHGMATYTKKTTPLALVALAVACAAPVRVSTTAEPGVDFAAFSTYALVPAADARDAVREIVETEIAEELDARGYRRVAVGDGDWLVVIQGRTQTNQRQVFAESPGGCCVIENYLAGTLQIEVFDATSGRRVWRGIGEIDLESESEENLEAAASQAAAAILKDFPPTDRTP